MKKTLLITLGIGVVAVGVAAAWVLTRESAVEPTIPGTSFPLVDSLTPGGRSTLTIEGEGVEMLVNDFLKADDVSEDTANPGYYYLGFAPPAGEEVDTSPYQILYIAETNYFNVTILEEPIGEVRVRAETDLKTRLGLSEEDMCLLSYTVGVPNSVNTIYTGMNLGFSFCPGAVKLP